MKIRVVDIKEIKSLSLLDFDKYGEDVDDLAEEFSFSDTGGHILELEGEGILIYIPSVSLSEIRRGI